MSNFSELITYLSISKEGHEYIEKQIKLILGFIAKSSSLDGAILYFKTLEDIQFILARAQFKERVVFNEWLGQFIYDYDRIDDPELRAFMYTQLKNPTPKTPKLIRITCNFRDTKH